MRPAPPCGVFLCAGRPCPAALWSGPREQHTGATLMNPLLSRLSILALVAAVAGCGDQIDHDRRYLLEPRAQQARREALYPNETPELRALIRKYASLYDVPEDLVHRVVIRESRHRPGARNGPYYGLMQMLPATARGMGYSGSASGLLDAETNLKYGVKYLRGAYVVAGGNPDNTVRWYSKGYYYEAKRKGLLKEAGLR